MEKKLGFAVGLLLGAVVIVALALLLSPSLSEQKAFNKTIAVSGNGVVKATPDEAHVMIAVVSEAVTAQEAATMNSANMTNIFAELEAAGIADVETRQYSITPIYTWIEEETLRGKEQKGVIVGYRATNVIEAVCMPDDAGTAIDAAVRGGSNRIDSISFQLSEALQESAYSDALRTAVNNAESKADVVADSMGIARIYPIEISVEEFYSPVVRFLEASEAAPVPAPSTPITPSEVEVNARVRIVYGF